jgi:uncharacterized repeat protein (TIGR03803 family)
MNMGPLRWGISYSALLWALAVCAPQPAAGAPQETVLYSFSGGPDGAFPLSELLITKNGALIGTASEGGDLGACGGKGCGVVFALTPPQGSQQWTEKVLYQFVGGSDGAAPLAGVLMDKTGALYGTTSQGGGGACHSYFYSSEFGNYFKGVRIGCGTIFKLTPPATGHPLWTETVLYPFQGKDGRFPTGVPLMERTGVLYGVTAEGGEGPCGHFPSSGPLQFPVGCGTAFRLTPPAGGGDLWTLTTLHKFTSKPDGAFPDGGVIFAPEGSLLGTTRGAYFTGTYFSTVWTYFSAPYRGGTVFQLTPPASGGSVWTETILYAFNGASGTNPPGGLVQDRTGALFGTTGGRLLSRTETVFQLSPPASGTGHWTEKTLHVFRYGELPSAGLTHDAATGAFYGVTNVFRGIDDGGTVFSLAPPAAGRTLWPETVLHVFGTPPDGDDPQARLTIGKAGNVYGTTERGGAHFYGTVFRVAP